MICQSELNLCTIHSMSCKKLQAASHSLITKRERQMLSMWDNTTLVIPILISALISFVLLLTTWRYGTLTGVLATPFIAYVAVSALWATTYAFQLATNDATTKLSWAQIRYSVRVFAPITWIWFVVTFITQRSQTRAWWLWALSVVPLITVGLTLTAPGQSLIWTAEQLDAVGDLSLDSERMLNRPAGGWAQLQSSWSITILLVSTLFLFGYAIRASGVRRREALSILVAVLPSFLVDAMSGARITPISLAPLTNGVTGLVLGWTVLRLQLVGIIPRAYALYFRDISDAILVLDAHGQVIDANPVAKSLFAAKEGDIMGRSAGEIMPASAHSTEQPSWDTSEFDLVLPLNGGTRAYSGRVSELRTGFGGRSGTIIVLRDITALREAKIQLSAQVAELREANAQLEIARRAAEEADRVKNEFLSTMSHELRTPLHVVLGYTELTLDVYDDSLTDRQRAALQRTLHSAKQLLTLINGILELAQLEAGALTLSQVEFDVKAWVAELANEITPLAAAKTLACTTQIDPRLPSVIRGDRIRLRQVAIHLLSNAVKFTETGFIRFEVRRVSSYSYVIEVTDTGIGISAEQEKVIFDLFRQADGSHARRYGGVGMGLRFVRRVVLLMGGQITVNSALGQGSTFTVLLPLYSPEAIAD
jgi:PAS domain S-box-containing protein